MNGRRLVQVQVEFNSGESNLKKLEESISNAVTERFEKVNMDVDYVSMTVMAFERP